MIETFFVPLTGALVVWGWLRGRRVGGPGLQGHAVGWVVCCRPGALTGRSWFGIGYGDAGSGDPAYKGAL